MGESFFIYDGPNVRVNVEDIHFNEESFFVPQVGESE